jgi:hypothetical protein
MRAVEGSLGHSLRERQQESEDPRWTRAVEDPSAFIPKERTSELEGIITLTVLVVGVPIGFPQQSS